MINVMNPEQIHETIPVDKLLFEVMKKKEAGLRLSQICVAYVNESMSLAILLQMMIHISTQYFA